MRFVSAVNEVQGDVCCDKGKAVRPQDVGARMQEFTAGTPGGRNERSTTDDKQARQTDEPNASCMCPKQDCEDADPSDEGR